MCPLLTSEYQFESQKRVVRCFDWGVGVWQIVCAQRYFGRNELLWRKRDCQRHCSIYQSESVDSQWYCAQQYPFRRALQRKAVQKRALLLSPIDWSFLVCRGRQNYDWRARIDSFGRTTRPHLFGAGTLQKRGHLPFGRCLKRFRCNSDSIDL